MFQKKSNTSGIIGMPLVRLDEDIKEIISIDYIFVIDKKENKKNI